MLPVSLRDSGRAYVTHGVTLGLWEGAGVAVSGAGVRRSQNRRFQDRPKRHPMTQIDLLALVSRPHSETRLNKCFRLLDVCKSNKRPHLPTRDREVLLYLFTFSTTEWRLG